MYFAAAACGEASPAEGARCALSDRPFARAAVAELPAGRWSAARRELEEAPPARDGIVVAARRARTDAPPTAGAGMLVLALAARRVRQYAEDSLRYSGSARSRSAVSRPNAIDARRGRPRRASERSSDCAHTSALARSRANSNAGLPLAKREPAGLADGLALIPRYVTAVVTIRPIEPEGPQWVPRSPVTCTGDSAPPMSASRLARLSLCKPVKCNPSTRLHAKLQTHCLHGGAPDCTRRLQSNACNAAFRRCRCGPAASRWRRPRRRSRNS